MYQVYIQRTSQLLVVGARLVGHSGDGGRGTVGNAETSGVDGVAHGGVKVVDALGLDGHLGGRVNAGAGLLLQVATLGANHIIGVTDEELTVVVGVGDAVLHANLVVDISAGAVVGEETRIGHKSRAVKEFIIGCVITGTHYSIQPNDFIF